MIRRRLPPERLPASRIDHAIGLAQIAEGLVLTQAAALADSPHVSVKRFPGMLGIMIWEAQTGQRVLHVNAQGVVLVYSPGPWEWYLGQLIPGMAPCQACQREREA